MLARLGGHGPGRRGAQVGRLGPALTSRRSKIWVGGGQRGRDSTQLGDQKKEEVSLDLELDGHWVLTNGGVKWRFVWRA